MRARLAMLAILILVLTLSQLSAMQHRFVFDEDEARQMEEA